MDYSPGDAVRILSGRDRGRLMRVLGQEQGMLLLADGRGRPVDHPKRKNPKHVTLAARADSAAAQQLLRGEPIRNSELRRDLAILGQAKADQDQGGI